MSRGTSSTVATCPIVRTEASYTTERLSKHETRPGIDNNGTEDERRGWAVEDLSDLSAADTLIAFTEYPNSEGRGRGGRHVEYGYAMAVGCDLIVVGPRENVFHSLRKVRQYPDWPTCLEALR